MSGLTIKDLDKKCDDLQQEIAQMKGGLAVAKWVVTLGLPVMIVLLGTFMKLQVDSLKHEIKASLVDKAPNK